MNRTLGLTLGLAAFLLSVAAAPAGDRHSPHVEKVNLADLKDGETRTFGKDDQKVTASRDGDEITIRIGGKGGEAKTLKCTVGKDSCYAMTVDGEGKNRVIVLNKSGDTTADRIMLREGDGSGEPMVVFSGDGSGAGEVVVDASQAKWVDVDAEGGHPAMVKVIRIHDDGGLTLQCPEGDATLQLKKGEENSGPYYCPKHNLKMEKSKTPVIMKKIEVETDGKGDEE